MPPKTPRKPTRRKSFNLRRVRYSSELALSTLASDTALTAAVFGAADGAYRLISLKGTYAIRGLSAGEGPVTIGWAHSDYSVTEIKECLEAVSAISQGDKIANEKTNRLIRTIGTFPAAVASSAGISLNEGRPWKTRLNWLIAVGDSVVFFVFNEDTGALSTGAIVNMQGDAWVKDVS